MATKKADEVTSIKAVTAAIEFTILKQAAAPKLSPKNPGCLTYQLGKHSDSGVLALRMIESDSGGYFSKEWIELKAIKSLLDTLEAGKSLKSSALRALFAGGSSNNAGFLAAVCRAEGILAAQPEKAFMHLKGHPVDDWIEEISKIQPVKTSAKQGKTKPETPIDTNISDARSDSLLTSPDSPESTYTKHENNI